MLITLTLTQLALHTKFSDTTPLTNYDHFTRTRGMLAKMFLDTFSFKQPPLSVRLMIIFRLVLC